MSTLTGRPIIFGEVLFDRFPDGNQVLGGAPFNVAWNLQALGQAPLLVSRVGDDQLGKRILDAMAEWGLDQTAVQIDTRNPTGTVEVAISDGEPEFTISEPVAYDFVGTAGLPDPAEASVIYHGSLALRADTTRKTWQQWTVGTSTPLFMDVNLRPPFWKTAPVLEQVGRARWVKLNEHELRLLVPAERDLTARARRLLHNSALGGLVVTRGEQGALFLDSTGRELRPVPVAAARVSDTVGAGDAFSSVVLLGLIRNWPWNVTLQRAQDFAAAVVGLQGATTRDRDFYRTFKQQWELS